MSASELREFLYERYAEAHSTYRDSSKRENSGRSAGIGAFLKWALPSDRSARILDFGCGDGALLSVADKLGYRNLTGVDISPAMVRLASSATSANVSLGDGLAFVATQPDETFDVVVAYDVLEHLTRDELFRCLKEIRRVLSPRGRLLIHVPNGASPFYGRIRWGDLTHEMAFTGSALEQLLVPLGFERIEAREDAPAAHGTKSSIRGMLWRLFRLVPAFWLALETGQARGHLLTQNICLLAVKK